MQLKCSRLAVSPTCWCTFCRVVSLKSYSNSSSLLLADGPATAVLALLFRSAIAESH